MAHSSLQGCFRSVGIQLCIADLDLGCVTAMLYTEELVCNSLTTTKWSGPHPSATMLGADMLGFC